MAVERADYRLVEVPELGQAGELAGAVVDLPPLPDLIALMGGLEVPAGGEDPVAAAGDDADPEIGVVAQPDEGLAQAPAGGNVDGVDLGPGRRACGLMSWKARAWLSS